MRRTLYLLLPVVFCLWLLTGCSGEKPFRITGELSDGANTNLYVKYYNGTAVNTLITAARDGKFAAKGFADAPTVVRILDKDNKLLALVFVRNGDEINVTIDRTGMASGKVTGNEVNDALTAFLNANAKAIDSGDAKKINTLVSDYIKANPDDIASAVLLGFVYDASLDPAEAAGLVASLGEKAQLPYVIGQLTIQSQRFANPTALGNVADFRYLKAGCDSALTFSTADKDVSLLVFSDDSNLRKSSIVPGLKDIYKDTGGSRLQIMDVVIANDTTAMKGMTRLDSAKWTQGWIPGGLLSDQLSRLGVPALPYYIVADSDGRQTYRGKSIDDARKAVEELIR